MKIVRDGAHFIGVGAIQLALDSAIYIALTKLGLALTLANVCGRAAGACCGFWLNGRVTFMHRAQPQVHARLLRYLLLWIGLTLISTLALAATNGDMNLAGASSTAGGALVANAAGTLTNDGGKLSSGAAMQIAASNLSNANGQLVSQARLDASVSGALNTRGGTMQAAGRETVHASSLDNTAGNR